MSNVNAEIKMQGNDNTWFTTNGATVYPANIQIFHTDGRYKFTDGVTDLDNLPFMGGNSSGVQSVSGANVDNTDPLNPVVNVPTLQEVTDEGATTIDVITVGGVSVLDVNSNEVVRADEQYLFVAKSDLSDNLFEVDRVNDTVKRLGNEIATVDDLTPKVGVIVKDITTSSALTGTTAITLLKSVLIPANTFTTGNIAVIQARAIRSTATGVGTSYIYINTSNTLSGATLVGIIGSAVVFYGMERNLYIKSSTVSETYNSSASLNSDAASNAPSANSDLNINWTVDQYIIHAFSLAAVGNSVVSSGLIVTKM